MCGSRAGFLNLWRFRVPHSWFWSRAARWKLINCMLPIAISHWSLGPKSPCPAVCLWCCPAAPGEDGGSRLWIQEGATVSGVLNSTEPNNAILVEGMLDAEVIWGEGELTITGSPPGRSGAGSL